MRIELQPAYILHSRPFRDTSLIVDFFTRDYGRVSLLAKGARNPKQKQRQLLQPFSPLAISWQGKSDLKTLIGVEPLGQAFQLVNRFLYSGFYANELLSYLLAQGDNAEDVYDLYAQLLTQLEQQGDLEPTLRHFEFLLLNYLGYGINFEYDVDGSAIDSGKNYGFVSELGFIVEELCSPEVLPKISFRVQGSHLLAIAAGCYDDVQTRQFAKKITRAALATHLQGKAIKSRELFV